MAYYTQLRRHPSAPVGRTWEPVYVPPWTTKNIDPKGTYLGGSSESTQETYSFRTGRLAEALSDEQEDALLAAGGSWGNSFSHYALEYRDAPQSSYDTGHEFKTTQKLVVLTPTLDERWKTYGYDYRYQGPVYAGSTGGGGTFISMAESNPSYYGPIAVGNTAPTKGYLDLAVTLAELKREGFPKLGEALMSSIRQGRAIQQSLGIGSKEYLAWEFGAKPLLSDYLKAVRTFADYRSRLDSFVQGSGKLLHRTYSFPIERTTTTYPAFSCPLGALSPSSSPLSLFQGSSTGTGIRTLTQTRRVWFSGAYTYYYPEGDSLITLGKQAEALVNQLIGQRLGADVIWNLAPWSWLSDWKLNIGQNIANAELLAQDGLVLKYGYLMSETISDNEITVTGPVTKSGIRGPWKTIYRTHVKSRVKASPYGFALTPGSFTARQWAILGALGFTKAPGVLH